MAGKITIYDKDVLNYSSGFFETIYNEMEDVIYENQITITPEISNFMNIMQVHSKGAFPYFNIEKYIKSHEGVVILLNILEEVIHRLDQEGQIYKSLITALWGFYKELMAYGDELKK